MTILAEDTNLKVRRYFEYYNRRRQGESIEEIAQALGLCSPDDPHMLPTDIFWLLRRDGFPVCGVCGETPAPVGHCEELNLTEYARRRMEELGDAGLSQPDVESRAIPKEGVPTNTCGAKVGDDALPMRLSDGRTAWIRFDPTRRASQRRAGVPAGTGVCRTPGNGPDHPRRPHVRASELKDALKASHVKVGEILEVSLDRDYHALKGSNKRVEDMVKRGRELLVQVLGEEGYWQHIETVKPYLDHWYSLFEEGRLEELTARQPRILLTEQRCRELHKYKFEGELEEEGEFGAITFEGLDGW